jgi:hypothetical protein
LDKFLGSCSQNTVRIKKEHYQIKPHKNIGHISFGFSYVFDVPNVIKNKIGNQGTMPSTNISPISRILTT